MNTGGNISAQSERSHAMNCMSSFVKKKQTVSVIVLEGEIGKNKALSLKKTKEMIKKAFKKPNLVAVALLINSGGGSPAQSQLIASYLLAWSDLIILMISSFSSDLIIFILDHLLELTEVINWSEYKCSGATPVECLWLPLLRTMLVNSLLRQ